MITAKTSNKANGFTLVEIVIALFIFAIIAVISGTSLHTIINVQKRTKSSEQLLSNLQIALIIMQRDIEQTVSRPIKNSDGYILPALSGDALKKQIEFTHAGFTNPFATSKRSTLQRVEYYLYKNQLVRKTWQVLDQAPNTKTSEKTLVRNVTDLQIRFLDANNQWQQFWPITKNQTTILLPKAIQVILTIKNLGEITRVFSTPTQEY